MTSKSFSSKGLLGNSMRRSLWALVLSGVGFFLSLLLPVLMQVQNALEMRAIWIKERPQAEVASNWSSAMSSVSELLGGINPLPKMVFLVLAVVCGVALFAYLHNRQKVDFYHSLPISRTPPVCEQLPDRHCMYVFDLLCHAGDHARLHICHGLRRGSALGRDRRCRCCAI